VRFVITGEWTRNRLLQIIVTLYALYVIGLWLTNALLYFNKMSLTAVSVIDYYLGSEERYLSPRSYQGLLEVSHFHLFAMGMLLLVLTHLILFVPLRNSTAKIAGFLLLEASLAVLVAVSLWSVFAGSQRNYDGRSPQSLGEDPES
jgi:hypothetical protein